MVRDELSVMSAFLAVADEAELHESGQAPPCDAVCTQSRDSRTRGTGRSSTARTSRLAASRLTEAGEQLLAELWPALTGIRGAETGIPSPLSPWPLPTARSIESSPTPTRPAFEIGSLPLDDVREWGDERAVTRKGLSGQSCRRWHPSWTRG